MRRGGAPVNNGNTALTFLPLGTNIRTTNGKPTGKFPATVLRLELVGDLVYVECHHAHCLGVATRPRRRIQPRMFRVPLVKRRLPLPALLGLCCWRRHASLIGGGTFTHVTLFEAGWWTPSDYEIFDLGDGTGRCGEMCDKDLARPC